MVKKKGKSKKQINDIFNNFGELEDMFNDIIKIEIPIEKENNELFKSIISEEIDVIFNEFGDEFDEFNDTDIMLFLFSCSIRSSMQHIYKLYKLEADQSAKRDTLEHKECVKLLIKKNLKEDIKFIKIAIDDVNRSKKSQKKKK